MSVTVQHRRGTTTNHVGFVGAEGEITVDTTKDVAVVHDGVTAGGWPQVTEAVLQTPARYSNVLLPPAHWNGGQATNRTLGDDSLKVTYMGTAPKRLTNAAVTVMLRTTTFFVAGTTGPTWAEVAIATGAVIPGGSPLVTPIAYADLSAILTAPTGIKQAVINDVTIESGVDWWLMVGNKIGTGGGANSANLRCFTVGDDLVIGIQGTIASFQPSANIGVGGLLVPDANNVNAMWVAMIL